MFHVRLGVKDYSLKDMLKISKVDFISFVPSTDHPDKLIFWRVIETKKNCSREVPGRLFNTGVGDKK